MILLLPLLYYKSLSKIYYFNHRNLLYFKKVPLSTILLPSNDEQDFGSAIFPRIEQPL